MHTHDNTGAKLTVQQQGRLTLKEVGVPLTAMGRDAATDCEPATGRGAVSPASVGSFLVP